MDENKQLNNILRDAEAQALSEEMTFCGNEPNEQLLTRAKQMRDEQVREFSLDFDAEEFIEDAPKMQDEPEIIDSDKIENTNIVNEANTTSETKKNKTIGRLLYSLFVITLSAAIAFVGILYFFEASGIKGTDSMVEITIPSGAYTAKIADALKAKGLINNTLFFRAYAKISKSDGLWQVGTFLLSSDMGYAGIVEELQTTTPRKNINVTIPEGFTIDKIAKLLEEKEVCTTTDFYNAVVNEEYDYDFVKAIPTASDGKQYAGRIYRLEGYLFPDTYNFYLGSSGKMVVEKMLANFNQKLTDDIRQQISKKGWNIDEAIVFASVIQGEAGKPSDMYAVSKVLSNRMQPNSGFPKLQCDSTRDYVNKILPSISGVEITTSSYDTYVREGLPVGAINNPGIMAIKAALNPSTETEFSNCYYFATDYNTGITYYSKTLAQHEAVCRKYKIGMYG